MVTAAALIKISSLPDTSPGQFPLNQVRSAMSVLTGERGIVVLIPTDTDFTNFHGLTSHLLVNQGNGAI
jgi:hypothetical protein